MKPLLFLFGLLGFSLAAQAQIPSLQLSPRATLEQKIGLTTLKFDYSRPSLRERQIFEEILAYDKIWRFGANAATSLETDQPLEFGGISLEKGKYAILVMPHEEEWEFRLYPYETRDWESYTEKEAYQQISVPVEDHCRQTETLEVSFQNISLTAADMLIRWGPYRLSIPLKTNTKDKMHESIEETLAGPTDWDYFNAGRNLYRFGEDLEKALKYVRKKTQADDASYWMLRHEAEILRELDRDNQALEVAKKGKKLAQEEENSDYVRTYENLIKELSN